MGARYAQTDLIWILGGDRDIDSAEERTVLDAMAAGLASGDGSAHLRTFHPRGPGRSREQLDDAEWIDFHMCQTSHAGVGLDTGIFIDADYALSPAKPVVDGEPRYGTLHPIHTATNRAFQTYTPPSRGDECDWVLVLDVV